MAANQNNGTRHARDIQSGGGLCPGAPIVQGVIHTSGRVQDLLLHVHRDIDGAGPGGDGNGDCMAGEGAAGVGGTNQDSLASHLGDIETHRSLCPGKSAIQAILHRGGGVDSLGYDIYIHGGGVFPSGNCHGYGSACGLLSSTRHAEQQLSAGIFSHIHGGLADRPGASIILTPLQSKLGGDQLLILTVHRDNGNGSAGRQLQLRVGTGGSGAGGGITEQDRLAQQSGNIQTIGSGRPAVAAVAAVLHSGGSVDGQVLHVKGDCGAVGTAGQSHRHGDTGEVCFVRRSAEQEGRSIHGVHDGVGGLHPVVAAVRGILRSSGESELSGYHVRRDLRGLIADGDCNGDRFAGELCRCATHADFQSTARQAGNIQIIGS